MQDEELREIVALQREMLERDAERLDTLEEEVKDLKQQHGQYTDHMWRDR